MTNERLDQFFTAATTDLESVSFSEPWKEFCRLRLLSRMRKRARYNVKGLKEKAISDFLAINSFVGERTVCLSTDVINNAREFISVALERVSKRFDETNIQVSFDIRFVFENWRFGPGAANGIHGSHAVEKINQAFTCNEVSKPLVKRLCSTNPYLARFNSEKDGYTSAIRGSRLSTVPKNEDQVRTIAIEPSGQMALQLGAGRYLEEALRAIGLDITDQQPKNKALARTGSIDNSLATIDMKSASDMISIPLVRSLMPKPWYDFLMTIRSSEISVNGEWHELKMISTMGNGFTFPLMTLIISSLLYAYRCSRNGPRLWIDWTNSAVFGDDVIVPVDEAAGFIEVLEGAGFVINRDKSFLDGPFRESCGGDYFEGYDVTPFYVRSLSRNSDVYVALNQVVQYMRRTNILLTNCLLVLKSFINGVLYFVPEWHNPSEGLLSSILVKRRYKYLKCISPVRLVKDDYPFLMMMACGGFVSASGSRVHYSPRATGRMREKFVARESRLPNGYLDGWLPDMGSRSSSYYISNFVQVVLG